MKCLRTLALVITFVAACSNAPPPVTHTYTVYTGTLAATSEGRERQARVTLQEDGRAAVQLSSWGGGDFFAEGTWRQANDGIVIDLPGAPAGRLVFRRAGDLMLGREWDRTLWGEKEPVLYLVR